MMCKLYIPLTDLRDIFLSFFSRFYFELLTLFGISLDKGICGHISKGQLISEWIFGVFKVQISQKANQIFDRFLP